MGNKQYYASSSTRNACLSSFKGEAFAALGVNLVEELVELTGSQMNGVKSTIMHPGGPERSSFNNCIFDLGVELQNDRNMLPKICIQVDESSLF